MWCTVGDIKPQNLMARADGIDKVLDFGLARRLPADGAADTTTGTDAGTLVGTVPYMSPEQAQAASPSTPPQDVFSLGVVLYELAAGQASFRCSTPEAGITQAIADQLPLPIPRLNPEAPAALDDLIQKMMTKDPRLRPTADEVDEAACGAGGQNRERPARGVAGWPWNGCSHGRPRGRTHG